VLAWEHSAEALARQLGRAEDIAGECAAADGAYRGGLDQAGIDRVFPPQPGRLCGWCDYQRHCPEGLAATEPRKPWDALAPVNG
jgi:hypothetical protein